MRRRFRTAAASSLVFLLALAGSSRAQDDGVSEERVLFGQSAPFSGPAGQLGMDFRVGVLAAFGEANAGGGVHGRKLELLSIDDYYDPTVAVANTRRLVEQDRVFALIGSVGAPCARAAVPIAAESSVPYISPYTGSDLLRERRWSHVINLRASYSQEAAEVVERIISDLNIRRIAVVHQDDSYGLAGLAGVQRALNERGLSVATLANYARNTTAVKTAVLELRGAQPGAVVLVGTHSAVAETVMWARHIGLNPVFVTLSFSGGNALASALSDRGQGDVYATQVVPFPASQTAIGRSYRRAMARHARNAATGYISFEGYLAGRLTIEGLERAGADLDRVRFLNSLLRGGTVNLDGLVLRFGEGDNQGSNQVYLTRIGDDGRYLPISRLGDEF